MRNIRTGILSLAIQMAVITLPADEEEIDEKTYLTPKQPERENQIQIRRPMTNISLQRALLSLAVLTSYSAQPVSLVSHKEYHVSLAPSIKRREGRMIPPKKLANKGLGNGRRR